MSASASCNICVALGTGTCLNNQTCVCHDGFIGITCQDHVTTLSTLVSQINIAAIIASVLGGALFTLIVGLFIFFIWKRRVKKKSFTFSSTASTIPSSEPVVVPALYAISLSRRESNATSAPTVSYHIYDELP